MNTENQSKPKLYIFVPKGEERKEGDEVFPNFYSDWVKTQQPGLVVTFENVRREVHGYVDLSQCTDLLELAELVLEWWHEHQFDTTGREDDYVYDKEPRFVTQAKAVLEKLKGEA